jgi:hypothetical protein
MRSSGRRGTGSDSGKARRRRRACRGERPRLSLGKMTWFEQWRALAARIEGLVRAPSRANRASR